jgi:hypothetical protein
MTSTKYIGMDVHKESISIAVRNAAGKIAMECVIETKASVILDFIYGLRGELHVTFEEGTWAAWLYDLLKPHVTKLVVCDPRKNVRQGNQNDRIDARELADRLYLNKLSSVYHGGAGVRTLKELARSYLTISKDLARKRINDPPRAPASRRKVRPRGCRHTGARAFETRARPQAVVLD